MKNQFNPAIERTYRRNMEKKAGMLLTGMGKESLFSTEKPTEKIQMKSSDSIKFATGRYGFQSFAPKATEAVKEAWTAAEKKLGIDGSSANHLSAVYALQYEQKKATGSGDVLGSTEKSAVAAVKKALSYLEGDTTKKNAKVVEYRQLEKDFYKAFLSYFS